MQSNKNRDDRNPKSKDNNRDPISGAPGSHPVGTGAGAAVGGIGGAAAGAAAGAATGTAMGGPVGTAVGLAAGAVVGAAAGKGIAEKIDPTAEDAYWRDHYKDEAYCDQNYTYDDYRPAYRTGYEGFSKWGASGKRYEDVESELRQQYERDHGNSRLSWDQARHATRAAWNRLDRDLSMYLDYDVVDQQDSKIGTLECLWSDQTGEPAFLGVRTGWIFGKTHVVPAQGVQVSERRRLIRIPFTKDKVKDAPFYDAESEMDEAREWEVHRYYGLGEARPAAAGQAPPPVRQAKERKRESSSRTAERSASIPLSEEKLKVGKRVVESGGVRLRKVIRTEVVNQPVELKREEAVIERVPSDKVAQAGEHAFEGEEIYIPLRREEPVIEKETRVREEVRVRKESHTDRQDVSEHLRREDVEVEEGGEARKAGRERTSAEEMRERQELPRSQRRGK